MGQFETLLEAERAAVERFVRFRMNEKADADDVLQEVFLAAYQKFSGLREPSAFKAWLLSIARNKCRDHFRKKAMQQEVPLDTLPEGTMSDSRHGACAAEAVQETLCLLGERDRQILYLYFWEELPQAEIARRLDIPVGTVKSRLHTAKQHFKNKYPYPMDGGDGSKGERSMKRLPEYIPEYRIEVSAEPPFTVKWEELMGWFLVPKLGEKLSWGMYDIPSRRCSHVYDMQVTGKAMVHGIEGVELTAREASCSDKKDVIHRTFVAQLTDTHCRYLATLRNDGDVRNLHHLPG